MLSGYLHPAYAASLTTYGEPVAWDACGAWVLRRSVPRADAQDLTGCYPLFCCRDWSALGDDLIRVGRTAVSFAAVVDPFADVSKTQLTAWFDRVITFKEYFVVDTRQDWQAAIHQHHRYYARRAASRVEVVVLDWPEAALDDWFRLYGVLVGRHGIPATRAFSKEAFARQLAIPGLVAFAARLDGEIVAMHLWYVQDDIAYSHLAASDERGYEVMAAYALYAAALDYLAPQVRWIHLGAGAGLAANGTDGLTRFKRGWANSSRLAYYVGRIFDPERYEALCRDRDVAPDDPYFPAYRRGEYA